MKKIVLTPRPPLTPEHIKELEAERVEIQRKIDTSLAYQRKMGLADIPTDTSYSLKEVYVDPSSRATAFICEHLYDYFRKCGFSNNEWVIPHRCTPLQAHLLEFNRGYQRV